MGRNHPFSQRIARLAQAQYGSAAIALTTAGVLLALVAAVVLGFRQSISVADGLDRDHEGQLVANYLERQASDAIARQKVQLTWDDAFRSAAETVDPAWTDVYLGQFLWRNFNYDRLYLVSPRGDLLRAWHGGLPVTGDAGYASLRTGVTGSLSAMRANRTVYGTIARTRRLADTDWPFDADGQALTRWDAAMIAVDGKPAQMTIAAIVPDTDMRLLRRTPNHLVAVRLLDAAYLADLGEALLLRDVRIGRGTGQDDTNVLPMFDRKGSVLGWLNWRSNARGALIAGQMKPLVAAFVCTLLALVLGGVAIVRDLAGSLSRLGHSEAKATHQARHDAMTGLANRVHFLDRLAAELGKRRAQPDGVVLLAYFDLDNFKFINDSLGHPVGDELVRQVARRCAEQLPTSDLLARLGGDEFVLMRCCDGGEGSISALGQELMAIFAAPFAVDTRLIEVTVSCGISWAPGQGMTAEELLRKADIALFRAKQRGRARWRAFSEDMATSVRRRLELETELRKALKSDRLELAYQPIVRAGSGDIVAVEALLRWNHGDYGAISPSLFVPVAEQAGLMPQLGWWTIRRVFAEQSAWPGLDVSVNLSPLQLTARGFVGELEALARDMRVDPRLITFEVTESSMMERGGNAFDVLRSLREMGFGLALDDFGTGYSSLGYLRAFRFDRLKIDRTFIQNIENEADARSILAAIIELARGLGIATVAEGVENTAQRDLVVAAGCEMIQGFFHHAPLSADDLSQLLATDRDDSRRVVPLRRA